MFCAGFPSPPQCHPVYNVTWFQHVSNMLILINFFANDRPNCISSATDPMQLHPSTFCCLPRDGFLSSPNSTTASGGWQWDLWQLWNGLSYHVISCPGLLLNDASVTWYTTRTSTTFYRDSICAFSFKHNTLTWSQQRVLKTHRVFWCVGLVFNESVRALPHGRTAGGGSVSYEPRLELEMVWVEVASNLSNPEGSVQCKRS